MIKVFYKNIFFKPLPLTVATTSFLLLCLNFFIEGFTEKSINIVIVWSARIGLLFFCISFTATSFYKLSKSNLSAWVYDHRTFFGPIFGGFYIGHLLFLFLRHYHFRPVFLPGDSASMAGGIIAYILIFLMLLTSTRKGLKQYISPSKVKKLHLLGTHWVWLYFLGTYGTLALKSYAFLPLVVILVIVMLIRIWAKWKIRTQKRFVNNL